MKFNYKTVFYYVIPISFGFMFGIYLRDSQTINTNQKITMALAEYYKNLKENPPEEILKKYPDLNRLLKDSNDEKDKKI